ncbi:uncharacterized protein LOC128293781 [Gossypium arboreum]|uniref:uncharacterized protein LOC128293781 n=1 Tax=Gossypium arboreum TaxID=29729 RepID=UPI0022F198FA|nr:uncharacterized protein LOC128293781 [Gossypium arboreum]
MLRYQWEDATRFWNSKKGEDRERVGTSSRQKQKFTHTAGSKSFACVAQAEEASSGQKVGRLQLLDITHEKKMELRCHLRLQKLCQSQVKFEVKRSIVQIQASTDEQISQLRAEGAAREAEQNRKYNELQQQLQSMMTMFHQFQNPPS